MTTTEAGLPCLKLMPEWCKETPFWVHDGSDDSVETMISPELFSDIMSWNNSFFILFDPDSDKHDPLEQNRWRETGKALGHRLQGELAGVFKVSVHLWD